MLRKTVKELRETRANKALDALLRNYEKSRIPWSEGYWEYRWRETERTLADHSLTAKIANGDIPAGYGVGLDERIVEFPWVIHNLRGLSGSLFDGGSTLNHRQIVENIDTSSLSLTFGNLVVESTCLFPLPVSYVLSDLRNTPFRDNWFDVVTCISTIEHVGMDNSIYGHSPDGAIGRSFDFVKVLDELCRITRPDGLILLTFPVGKFENHGFFQQFDEHLLTILRNQLNKHTTFTETFFRYDR